MSIENTALNRSSCWLFINSLPELDAYIASFMDYGSLANARQVCKGWASNAQLKNRLDQFSDTILPTLGYPLEAIQILRKNGIELRDLKIVPLDKAGDYFDYLTKNNLRSNAIVRVKNLFSGCVGIIFYVQGKIEGQVDIGIDPGNEVNIKIKRIAGFVAFGQRDINDKEWWVGVGGSAWLMKGVAYQFHKSSHIGGERDTCPTCIPIVVNSGKANYEFLNSLLSGKHPMLEITTPPVKQPQQ